MSLRASADAGSQSITLSVLAPVYNERYFVAESLGRLETLANDEHLSAVGPWNFGTLDEVLGHRRRYNAATLAKLAADCEMEVRELIEFNRVGSIAWYLNGRILRRRRFGLAQVRLLNLITPLMRRLDKVIPIPPLSLIAVLTRRTGNAESGALSMQPAQAQSVAGA
jgi:hypothetical protein